MLAATLCCFAAAAALAFADATHVYVMLPLDTVTSDGHLKQQSALESQLDALRSANVDGFMVDVWWGITERKPKSYDFSAYQQLLKMAKDRSMKVQFVTSFHMCGGNVGDTCDIPLPAFVTGMDGIWYKDQDGNEDKEYISLFADSATVAGRSPLQMYHDWFAAFARAFADDLGSHISTVQVGLGPAGELRYPAYQLSHWHFCGVGAFQCWDEHALADLEHHATKTGHPEWSSPPTDAGSYNSQPEDTAFFQEGYASEKGMFFLDWYFSALKRHGAAVLSRARAVFGEEVTVSAKVSGIHWWYKSKHHAAELTAGYLNVAGRDAYMELAELLANHGKAELDFTCLEMRDTEQPAACDSGPEELVRQVLGAAKAQGTPFSGENALSRYDTSAYSKIESYKDALSAFTYLRLSDDLLQDTNFNAFKNFVQAMHAGKQSTGPEVVVL